MIVPNKDDFYLFQDILERNYFKDFRKGKKNIEFLLSSDTLSLNSCSNCTIEQSILYPEEDIFIPNSNKNENLLLLIDWYISNQFICPIEFNGCIEDENIENLILTLNQIIEKFNNTNYKPRSVIFHTKMKNLNLISSIFDIFKDTIQTIFYIHLDGYFCDNNYNEEYYDQIITFIKDKQHFYFKSTVNNLNIDKWIQNYQWWIKKLGLTQFLERMDLHEILNNNWDQNSIQNYLNFLNFQIDYLFEKLDKFESIIYSNNFHFNCPFTIQILDRQILTNKNYYQNCLFHNGLTIDLLTLKIPACCKLNYPMYHIGEFKYDNNNKNFNISPINLSMSIVKAHLKRSSTPHCEYCSYLNLCEKTCYGENFEVSFNPLCPILNSCLLMQCKYNFLIYKYKQMDLFDLEHYDCDPIFINDLLLLDKQISQKGNQNK